MARPRGMVPPMGRAVYGFYTFFATSISGRTEQGYALYDWRTRRRLEISQTQIEKNIQLATKAICKLKEHAPRLIDQLEWDEDFEKLFSTVPELSESEDTEAENDTT